MRLWPWCHRGAINCTIVAEQNSDEAQCSYACSLYPSCASRLSAVLLGSDRGAIETPRAEPADRRACIPAWVSWEPILQNRTFQRQPKHERALHPERRTFRHGHLFCPCSSRTKSAPALLIREGVFVKWTRPRFGILSDIMNIALAML